MCTDLTGSMGAGPSPAWLTIVLVQWLLTFCLVSFLGRSPRRRPLAFLLLVFSASTTLDGYEVRRWTDLATGVPDLSIMVGYVLTVLGAIATLNMVAALTGPARRRWVRWARALLVSGTICLIALFWFIPRRLDHPDFGCWQARSPLVIGYQLLFQTLLAAGFLVTAILVGPRVKTAGSRLIRTALRLVLAGSAFGLLYAAQRDWWVIAHGFGLPYPLEGPRYGIVPVVLLESALILTGAGVLVPVLHRTGLFLRRLIYHHRLRPLWTALTEAAPGNVLGTPLSPPADLLRVRGVEGRLYRRTIEIRDAQWELAAFVSPAMAEAAAAALKNAGPSCGEADAVLEALLLEIARRAKPAGVTPLDSPGTAHWSGGSDLDTDARALLEVHHNRNNHQVQTIAAAIVRDERERTTPTAP
jgi:hypothetical protein